MRQYESYIQIIIIIIEKKEDKIKKGKAIVGKERGFEEIFLFFFSFLFFASL